MAIYKTISSKEIVRKVMRDLNPEGGDWLHDAIEWIGEALEHIGSSAQLETKVCTVEIKDHKGMLPADLYLVNQVGVSEFQNADAVSSEISDLTLKAMELTKTYQDTRTYLANKIEGELLNNEDLKNYSNLSKQTDHELREINSRLVVLENTFMGGDNMMNVNPLKYCTSNFPKGLHCDSCVNEHAVSSECYMIESDYIKTSFSTGRICLSYKAMPTDADCYPLVPDDISFKEAMFWYIFKKMLLGGTADPTKNGMNYQFADQQWKYYCSQARNSAVFPDIDRYESFMNQWVRLIPNINRHDLSFDDLGEREDLYRGQHNTFGQ